IQDALLVREVDQRTYQGDKTMTTLTLGNASGTIGSAPFWEQDQHLVAGVKAGDVVQVIGEVGAYKDRRQLQVTSLRVLPRGKVDWGVLLPSAGDVSRYWETIDKWRAEIAGPRLRAVVSLFYDDEDFRARYGQCPASTVGHHAELGGLIKHTVEVASIGRHIAKVARADVDLVTAGVLLHDIGKLEAYRWDGLFAPTDKNALYGHVVLGALMLDDAVRSAEPMPCTEQELDILMHLVLAHHGRLEFGAPVEPKTLEAEIVHYADNASAKTASFADALADPSNFSGEELVSAKGIWSLDKRRAYRGTSDWGVELQSRPPLRVPHPPTPSP
ncbi:MAG TPA: HD domain-containing protein, partial [Gemmatimonadales bacterium]|nr:HD domain-containing protein [Gemmatimonadales bacterium]